MPKPLVTLLLFAALALTAGCGGDAPPTAAALPKPARMPKPLAQAPSAPSATPLAAAWAPPYPGREDLFAPPKRSRTARRSTTGDDETVQLLGFVSVDQPKAVLSIEGVVASVPAGAQKYGIEVISITPPEVVLQRGRNRWKASLE